MRMRALKIISGPTGSHQPGEEFDCSPMEAKQLLDAGAAEPVQIAVETAALEAAPETAMNPPARPRKRRKG